MNRVRTDHPPPLETLGAPSAAAPLWCSADPQHCLTCVPTFWAASLNLLSILSES